MSRKLDAAIAEALGYEVRKGAMDIEPKIIYVINGERYINIVLPYSTDGNAMLELDGEMRARGWIVSEITYMPYDENKWLAEFAALDHAGYYSIFRGDTANTMPEAVALAAYKALTGKEWIEP